MKKEKIDWIRLLKEKKAYCYIKPNRHIHESGFRCFEVGYLIINKKNRVEDKFVLGKYSDLVQLYEYNSNGISPNIDLTLDGYFRILPYANDIFWWGTLDPINSTAEIKLLKEEE